MESKATSKSVPINNKRINDLIKRFFDFLLSLCGIILLSPILLIIYLLIKIDSKGPALFLQTRVGRNGLPFKIAKFRTMIVDAEKVGKQITIGRDPRITRVGHHLRKYKLDELPQLFNVLKGEMSLVGPRPEVPKYVNFYTEEQRKILEVRPGITDYASIKYINENELLEKSKNPERTYIEEIMVDKLKLNLEYVIKRSIFEDVKIILMTLLKIVA
jgi:lipopolysaccharide/colanic/teichoic acid biosynthesis glycosyltransferase